MGGQYIFGVVLSLIKITQLAPNSEEFQVIFKILYTCDTGFKIVHSSAGITLSLVKLLALTERGRSINGALFQGLIHTLIQQKCKPNLHSIAVKCFCVTFCFQFLQLSWYFGQPHKFTID